MFLYDTIRLRKLDTSELGFLQSLKQQSWMWTHRVSLLNGQDQERWFNSLSADVHSPTSIALVADGSGNTSWFKLGVFLVSRVNYVNRTAEVSWIVDKSHQKKGWGKKIVKAGTAFCFQILGAHRVECEILANNLPSMKCAVNAGYQHEGTKRQSVFKLGDRLDSHIFGVLVHEFTCETLTASAG